LIFFIAPNPHVSKREGFLQRVYAIDQLLVEYERKYIEDCEDEGATLTAMIEADVIYIHSMYQAVRIVDYLESFADKVVIDLHGVVSEELEYLGDHAAAKKMSATEQAVFSVVSNFVAVTDYMVKKQDRTLDCCANF
jgi:hypothetical protein